MRKTVLFSLALLLIAAAAASAIDCPSCGSRMFFTGQTDLEWGKLIRLYRCPAGHEYWVTSEQESRDERSQRSYGLGQTERQDQSRPGTTGQASCPICGASMYFTGRTKLEFGRLLKIYRCPAGHEAVAQ